MKRSVSDVTIILVLVMLATYVDAKPGKKPKSKSPTSSAIDNDYANDPFGEQQGADTPTPDPLENTVLENLVDSDPFASHEQDAGSVEFVDDSMTTAPEAGLQELERSQIDLEAELSGAAMSSPEQRPSGHKHKPLRINVKDDVEERRAAAKAKREKALAAEKSRQQPQLKSVAPDSPSATRPVSKASLAERLQRQHSLNAKDSDTVELSYDDSVQDAGLLSEPFTRAEGFAMADDDGQEATKEKMPLASGTAAATALTNLNEEAKNLSELADLPAASKATAVTSSPTESPRSQENHSDEGAVADRFTSHQSANQVSKSAAGLNAGHASEVSKNTGDHSLAAKPHHQSLHSRAHAASSASDTGADVNKSPNALLVVGSLVLLVSIGSVSINRFFRRRRLAHSAGTTTGDIQDN